jgi:hypothetical protein
VLVQLARKVVSEGSQTRKKSRLGKVRIESLHWQELEVGDTFSGPFEAGNELQVWQPSHSAEQIMQCNAKVHDKSPRRPSCVKL